MLPLAHASAWIAASVLLVAAVLVASLAPLSLPSPAVSNADKFEHALAYAGLAVWFTGLVPRQRYWRVAIALVLLGLVIELLQGVMPFGRQSELLDLLANVVGIGAGMAMAIWITGGWAPRMEAWLKPN